MHEDYIDANRKLWDARVPAHRESEFYDLERFKKTKDSLNGIEKEGLGDVKGKSLLHLQCHFGQDTLSWAAKGAEVWGVDFSGEAIALARSLAEEMDLPAQFLESDVLKIGDQIGRRFDVVFTSYGTVVWLPDANAWARTIRDHLEPGGIFYMADFHPFLLMYDHGKNTISYPYFGAVDPMEEVEEGSYANRDSGLAQSEFFWLRSLAEIMTPLLDVGLELLEFREFDTSPYGCFPNMRPLPEGGYRFGPDENVIPHVFSLKMRRPLED